MAQNLQEWVAPRRALGDCRSMHRRERDRCRDSAASKFIHNTRINNYETFSSAKMIPPWNNNNNHILLALNCRDGKKIMKWVVGPLLEAGRQNARLLPSFAWHILDVYFECFKLGILPAQNRGRKTKVSCKKSGNQGDGKRWSKPGLSVSQLNNSHTLFCLRL